MERESGEGQEKVALPPRLDPDEIEYLTEFMLAKDDGAQMIEWGSGGSTTMFAPYFKTGTFISVEHNKDWFVKVTAGLNDLPDKDVLGNCVYCLAEPLVDIRFYGYGVPYEENPCYANNYINPKIDGVNIWASDIYFVDGICRGAILANIAMRAEKRDAVVLIHDHFGPEQRQPWYEWAVSFYSSAEQVGNTLARLHLED